MTNKLPTEDGFARYRDQCNRFNQGSQEIKITGHEDFSTTIEYEKIEEPLFQQRLAEFLDRQDVVKAITKAVESERYVNDIVRAIIAALKKEAGL